MHFRCLSVVNFICLIPESRLRDPVQPFGLDANLKSLRILDVCVSASAVADKCLHRRSSLHLSKPSQTLSSDRRSSQNAERDADMTAFNLRDNGRMISNTPDVCRALHSFSIFCFHHQTVVLFISENSIFALQQDRIFFF